jgi:hypothetical protein
MKNLEHYLEKAIKNIEDDREITRELLDDVVRYMAKDEALHAQVGSTAAKYVETLQRSNEQLVKISSLIEKKDSKSKGLSDIDKNEIFDMLQGEAADVES